MTKERIFSCFSACFKPKKRGGRNRSREIHDQVTPVTTEETMSPADLTVKTVISDISPVAINDVATVVDTTPATVTADVASVVDASDIIMVNAEKSTEGKAYLGYGDAAAIVKHGYDVVITQQPLERNPKGEMQTVKACDHADMAGSDTDQSVPPAEPQVPIRSKFSFWLKQEFIPPPPSKEVQELVERIRTQQFRFPRIQQDWLRKQILKKNWTRSIQKVHKEVSTILPLYPLTEEKMEQEKMAAFQKAQSKRPDCKWRAFVFPRMPPDWMRKQLLREAFMDDVMIAYRGLQRVLPLYNRTMEELCAAEGDTMEE